jgi:uncharacterized protein (TIGR02453 family)
MIITDFKGFSPETFGFLSDLKQNNNKEFFHSNKERYNKYLISAAKEFIISIAPFFNQLNSSIRTHPRFNETIMRMNKDMRFSKGEPYRNFLLIHFGRFKMDSEFYVYLDEKGISYGLFLNREIKDNLFLRQNLEEHKNEFIETFIKYGLNNNFCLQDIQKEMRLITKRFDINKHYSLLKKLKFMVLEKQIGLKNKLTFSPGLIGEAIKIFSKLYPIYCFAISSQPLKLIEEFEDKMGVTE